MLAINIIDSQRLTDIFGKHAVLQTLAQLAARARALMERLLAQHEVLDRHGVDAEGRWATLFRVRSDELPRDSLETYASIEAAGRVLAHDMSVQSFGAGTGMRVRLALVVRPLSSEAWAAHGRQPPAHWLDGYEFDRGPHAGPHADAASAEVADILAGRRPVHTVLQPIVRMRDRAVIGYEALSRGPQGSPLERPDLLFSAARACGSEVCLELLCADLALQRTRGRLPAGRFLTVNLGPQALTRAAQALPLADRREVLFELTEHLPLDAAAELAMAVDQLHDMGIGLALDDAGCGFADMDTVRTLRPDIVKLCITVVRHAGKGAPFDTEIADTAQRLSGMGCRVLAEGVETQAQHDALTRCSIELAQGWLYGRPAAVDAILPAAAQGLPSKESRAAQATGMQPA